MRKPNVVLINCDDLGYGDLGCYGSVINRTPCIDEMAKEGLRLTSFYMASPLCSPSRGAMLTGCYPPRIGFGSFDGEWVLFPGQGVGLSEREHTIADMLRDNGYRTKLVGKWHCGDQPAFLPTRHGFDEYYGLPYSNDMGRQRRPEPGWADFPPLPLLRGEEVIQQQPDQASLTERYVEQATGFIHENRDRPFFLYFAHMHVHLPLYAPERFIRESANGDYGACVACVDWAVQCVRHQLRQDGIERDTLIIFTSDNGARGDHGGSNQPLRGGKCTTWEGGVRVPCIWYWPGHIPAGVSGAIVTAMDFMPALEALCGVSRMENRRDMPAAIDGLDCSALILGKSDRSAREIFYYYLANNLQAVRCGNWKLHVRASLVQGRPVENVRLLYNLEDDISETVDQSLREPLIVNRLETLLDEARRDLGDEAAGVKGENIRPIGRAPHPRALTEYDKNHPYIIAMYDKEDCG